MDKNDRELLEMAAKAAGIHEYTYCELMGGSPALYCKGAQLGIWAPLTDDGDALRLAVTLHLSIMPSSPGEEKPVVQVSADDGGENCTAFAMEPFGQDHAAATRRAIVRAAAAIGKMP